MQGPYIESTDPRFQLDRAIRQATADFIGDRITTQELLQIVSKLKAASHV